MLVNLKIPVTTNKVEVFFKVADITEDGEWSVSVDGNPFVHVQWTVRYRESEGIMMREYNYSVVVASLDQSKPLSDYTTGDITLSGSQGFVDPRTVSVVCLPAQQELTTLGMQTVSTPPEVTEMCDHDTLKTFDGNTGVEISSTPQSVACGYIPDTVKVVPLQTWIRPATKTRIEGPQGPVDYWKLYNATPEATATIVRHHHRNYPAFLFYPDNLEADAPRIRNAEFTITVQGLASINNQTAVADVAFNFVSVDESYATVRVVGQSVVNWGIELPYIIDDDTYIDWDEVILDYPVTGTQTTKYRLHCLPTTTVEEIDNILESFISSITSVAGRLV